MKTNTKSKKPRKTVDFSAVVEAVALDRIRLWGASARRNINEASEVKAVDTEISYGAQLNSRDENAFIVEAPIQVTVRESEEKKELVRVRVTFLINYSLGEGVSGRISDEQLESFAAVNGAFNAWPYWREYVHQTFQRMELPSVLIPAFKYKKTDVLARKAKAARTRKPTRKAVSNAKAR